MCFSPRISATFAIVGAIITVISWNIRAYREEYFHWIAGFYTLMEILQTFQYSYVNQCNHPMNKLLTELAYVFIIVQPLLWNYTFYLRATRHEDKHMFKMVIVLCAIWIVANIYSRVSYDPKGEKKYTKCGFLYGDQTCTLRQTKSSHLYWKFQTRHFRDLNPNYFMYFVLWFVPALMVKETRLTSSFLIVSLAIGVMLSLQYSATMFEFPSIWCYISVPFILGGFLRIYFQKIRSH